MLYGVSGSAKQAQKYRNIKTSSAIRASGSCHKRLNADLRLGGSSLNSLADGCNDETTLWSTPTCYVRPLGSLPVGSLPVGSLPVGSLPVGSLPVAAGGSPLCPLLQRYPRVGKFQHNVRQKIASDEHNRAKHQRSHHLIHALREDLFPLSLHDALPGHP